jgi:hypothetical protein
VNLIADTNVWYDIASKQRDPKVLKANGQHRLVATPTSILEIASLIDGHNLQERQSATQAILEHSDDIAVDCEYHLATLWGLAMQKPDVPWRDACKAIAQAPSTSALQSGVADFSDRVLRRVNVSLARTWRLSQWEDFKSKVVDAIDSHVPGYKAAREKGKVKHLKRDGGNKFSAALKSVEARNVFVAGTFYRALLIAGQAPRMPTEKEFTSAAPLVSAYVDAYTEYLVRCATEYAPQTNDLGDSECFLYLQADTALVSSDRRWVEIARCVCPARYCDPENKVS